MNDIQIDPGNPSEEHHPQSNPRRKFQCIFSTEQLKRPKMTRILPWVLILILFTGANAFSSHLLSQRDRHLIEIAFMNGSVEMLSFDIDVIEKAKNNPKLMEKMVQDAAGRYLAIVEKMNSQKKIKIDNKKGNPNHPYNYIK